MKISGGGPLIGNGGRIREGKERSPPGYFIQGPRVVVTPLALGGWIGSGRWNGKREDSELQFAKILRLGHVVTG